MKQVATFILLLFILSCGNTKTKSNQTPDNSMELYTNFDTSNHLQPLFDKIKFDTSHSWDFGWAVLEPINIANGKEDEKLLARRFSPGQKALYFFWYLDAEVTNGGFIQFYWNDNRKYLPPIIDGLKLIGDTSMLDLINKADKEYLKHKEQFILQRQKDNWQSLYDGLKNFEDYDIEYYLLHDRTMELIEKYARQYPDEFVKFK
jgi:hypothetical protein